MGLTRNRAFACQLALLAGALAVFAAAAAAVEGPRAGLWVLAAGALACALFATFSLRRYRQIARLASEVDEVLHGGRRIAFSDYREGDLAVLRNELAKMVAALRTATERLDAEKNALADALATCRTRYAPRSRPWGCSSAPPSARATRPSASARCTSWKRS